MNQFPKSYEGVRAAVVAFMRACDPHLDKLRERQMLKEAIKLMDGQELSLSTGLKHTGIRRKLDQLGRFVVPKEIRTVYRMDPGEPMEFFLDEAARTIVMQPFKMDRCAICKHEDDLTAIKDKHLCEDCISKVFQG